MQIPEQYHDLLNSQALAHLATLMPDGSPQVTPVWFDYDGEHIRINSAVGRQKDRNIRRNPHVAVSIVEADGSERALVVRGVVSEVTTDGALEHIDALARKYRGDGWTPVPNQQRVIYKITPQHVHGD